MDQKSTFWQNHLWDPVYMSKYNMISQSIIFKNLSRCEVDWLAIKLLIAHTIGHHDIKSELKATLKPVLKAVVLNT